MVKSLGILSLKAWAPYINPNYPVGSQLWKPTFRSRADSAVIVSSYSLKQKEA